MKPITFGISITLLGIMFFQACQSSQPFEAKNYDYSELKSPLKDVNVAFETVEIDASEPKVVRLENGSSLNVPKDAFVDENGKKIKGKVSLKYRQFDDAADIIASGIPMTYHDALGKTEQLESGGMFELKGEVNGQPVYIAPGKSIQTNLASKTPGAYDFYYLEPDAQVGKDQAYNWKKMTNEVDDIPPSNFEAVDSFQLKFNTRSYPELAPFKDIQWQLGQVDVECNPNKADNSWVLEEEWSRIEISQPKFGMKVIKKLLTKEDKDWSISPDDKMFVINGGPELKVYNREGDLVKKVPGIGKYRYAVNFLSDDLILVWDKDKKRTLRDRNLNVIKELGNAIYVNYSVQKERIVYQVEGSKKEDRTVFVINKDGKEIFKKKYQLVSNSYYRGSNWKDFLTQDSSCFIISAKDGGIQVIDLDGNLKNSLENKEDFETISIGVRDQITYSFYELEYKYDFIRIRGKDNTIKIWDWREDKFYTFEGYKGEGIGHLQVECHPTLPLLLLSHDERNINLWNWKKNIVKKIKGKLWDTFSPKGNFIHVAKEETKEAVLYDKNGTQVLSYKFKDVDDWNYYDLNYTEDESHVLIKKGEVKLYDNKGVMIKDFRLYDKEINQASFVNDGKRIMTYTQNGLLICWDLKGNLIQEIKIKEKDFSLWEVNLLDSLCYRSWSFDIRKDWNGKGELLRDYGRKYLMIELNKKKVGNRSLMTKPDRGLDYLAILDCTIPLNDSNIYQLTLIKEKKEYWTYVYLDAKTKLLIEEYNAKKTEKRLSETKRKKEEAKLLRTFAIQNFGIYNWDRFYKDDVDFLVRCKVEFGDEVTNEYSDITVFLISGENRNVVIKYDESTFEKFNFNSSLYNKLIAILPDNKIAVFEDKDFKALDLNKIREKKQHKFEMKILGGVDAMDALKKMTDVAT